MNKKIIAFGLSFTLILSLHAIQPGADRTAGLASKKALPQLNVTAPAGITAYGADNEAIPLGEPVRRIFRNNSRGTVDTLDNGTAGTVNFGFFPGDVMLEVYKAPTDLIMWGVGVDVYGWNTDGFTPSLKVEVWRPGTGGYPYLSDGTTYPSSVVDGGGWAGYAHTAASDTVHYADTSYVGDNLWNDFTYGVCDSDTVVANNQPLMGTKALPKGFVDYTITKPSDDATGLYWVDFTSEGGAAFVTDEYIAVVVTYLETGAGDPLVDASRIGLLSGDATAIYPYVGAKFYNIPDCGGTGGESGWYIRHYNWRFAYAVELTGDRGPVFTDIDVVPTTLSTEDRTFGCTLTDDNPSGGAAGVASVTLTYKLDSLTAVENTVSFAMTAGTAEDGTWEGTIPGQAVGTFVYWSLTATDVGALSTTSGTYSYTIFAPTTGNDLIFDNQDPLYGSITYASWLYFYWGGTTFDIWSAEYGGIVDELTGHYTTIVELGSDYDNDAEITAWWGGDKTYIVSGDEWLGARSGWTDGPTADGSVAKSILGVAHEYNDINYATSGDDAGISRLVAGASGFASAAAAFLSDSLYLNYDPDYETGRANWLDGIDAVTGYTVDMTGYSGILDSADQVDPPTDSEVYNVMIHGQAGNGGKSAFLSFDAMALNTVPSYYWIGAADGGRFGKYESAGSSL